jgi:hypothetical protein
MEIISALAMGVVLVVLLGGFSALLLRKPSGR